MRPVNITRRGFISMLALAGTGAVLLPNRKFFLPERLTAMEGDFTTENLRYKYTERLSVGFTNWEGIYGSSPDMTEASLEKILQDLAQFGRSVMRITPTRLVVHPDKVDAAKVAFPGQVEAKYFSSPSTWYLKADASDIKMASLFERHAHAMGIRVRRA